MSFKTLGAFSLSLFLLCTPMGNAANIQKFARSLDTAATKKPNEKPKTSAKCLSITSENFKKEIEQSKKPVILDFYSPNCPPCRMAKPIFEKIAEKLSDQYTFGIINVEKSPKLADKFGISSLPTFIFMKKNKVLSKKEGFAGEKEFEATIKQSFASHR